MTLPRERKVSVKNTEAFLLALCDADQTPGVPSEIRLRARGLLKHYPSDYCMEEAAKLAPSIFGDDHE